jgi:hypothetical protein
MTGILYAESLGYLPYQRLRHNDHGAVIFYFSNVRWLTGHDDCVIGLN